MYVVRVSVGGEKLRFGAFGFGQAAGRAGRRAVAAGFRDFREDAANNGFKYFLEVFNPNLPHNMEREALGDVEESADL